MTLSRGWRSLIVPLVFAACAPEESQPPCEGPACEEPNEEDELQAKLEALVLPEGLVLPEDLTNRHADDPRAVALGKKFFFDPRFSGPLLDSANDGLPETLGTMGETGKVACAGCHVPEGGAFSDSRSPRGQLSLAAGWTQRRAPSLLNVGQSRYLAWGGRRDSVFSQVFNAIESPFEFNSSRLFVAQQIASLYRDEYEALFGALPATLAEYAALAPTEAGCTELPADRDTVCMKPGHDDEAVVRVVVNFGKAIHAYTRTLSCGRSRFDEWMDGDPEALTADEQAGARLFVGKAGCGACHSGPYLTDGWFHNVGVPGQLVPFTGVDTSGDPGAARDIERLLADPLNSRGIFSDGDDGRLDALPEDLSTLAGKFKTPSLRCVSRGRAFMHNGEYRSLEELVDLFVDGPAGEFVGEAETGPRDLDSAERTQLVAFLEALDGRGPGPEATSAPVLPP